MTAAGTPSNANTNGTMSTNNTVKANTTKSQHNNNLNQSTEKTSLINAVSSDNAKHSPFTNPTESHHNNGNGHLNLRTFD